MLNYQRKSPGHFTERQWSDFVRGVAPRPERAEMQAHLDSGCLDCFRMAELFAQVARLGAADAAAEIPADVMARARAIFVPQPSGWIESLEAIVAELVMAVRPQGLVPGVRSLGEVAETTGGRMLFRAGEYSVDLDVGSAGGGDDDVIVGQIVNDVDRAEDLDGVIVQMVVPGRTLGETSTNRFGEFLMRFPSERNAMLRLALKDRARRIDLRLIPAKRTGKRG